MAAIDVGAWDAATWSAIGVWATVAVYLVLAVYAIKQVGEARELREQQVRPFVIVHFDVNWLTELVVENVGSTMASDVRIEFEPPLASTVGRPWGWEESTLFTHGIPTLAPNKRIPVFFDSMISRFDSDLPLTYKATVKYCGPRGKKFTDVQILDLAIYKGTSQPPEGIPDLVKAVEKLHDEMRKWTDGISGLRVNASNRERAERLQARYWRLRRTRDRFRDGGIVAAFKHLVSQALRRSGWVR